MAFNHDSYLIARQKVIDTLTIPEYYMDYVDEERDLDFYAKDCCPLHDEDSPSFFYLPDRQMFHCFGCGLAGSVVELHYHLQLRSNPNYKKVSAVRDLAKMYEIEIPNLFKGAKLSDLEAVGKLGKLGDTGRLKPRKREDLVKPRKKVELELEALLSRSKVAMSVSDYQRFVGDIDEVFFLGADVTSEVKRIEGEIMSCVEASMAD